MKANITLQSSNSLRGLGKVFQVRHSSSLMHLHSELTSRKLPLLFDHISTGPSFLLYNTLRDFIPQPPNHKLSRPEDWKYTEIAFPLAPSHHLVYFPPSSRLSELLPDGTDPDQSPGAPFNRRMWAGGRMQFFPTRQTNRLRVTRNVSCCFERISDVSIKGRIGEEKVFVTVERRMSGANRTMPRFQTRSGNGFQNLKLFEFSYEDTIAIQAEENIRRELMNDDNCSVIEQRDIVFLRDKSPEEVTLATATRSRVVKAPHQPTFSHVLTPSPALLFRFSALTWNAHSIHLDKAYCREVEGHRNLLVHGPLSVVMMVELLRAQLDSEDWVDVGHRRALPASQVSEIEYRNLAPLYAEEEMRICGRARGDGSFDLWIEGKDGGMCVKGVAKTEKTPVPARQPARTAS